MKQIQIVNEQKTGKFAGTSRTVNTPDWLYHVKGIPDGPEFGDYELFQADEDIDQTSAFKALANYAVQHMPVSFRAKSLNLHSVYAWLRGEMQSGTRTTPEKLEGIELIMTHTSVTDRSVLMSKSPKRIEQMIEDMRLAGLIPPEA